MHPTCRTGATRWGWQAAARTAQTPAAGDPLDGDRDGGRRSDRPEVPRGDWPMLRMTQRRWLRFVVDRRVDVVGAHREEERHQVRANGRIQGSEVSDTAPTPGGPPFRWVPQTRSTRARTSIGRETSISLYKSRVSSGSVSVAGRGRRLHAVDGSVVGAPSSSWIADPSRLMARGEQAGRVRPSLPVPVQPRSTGQEEQ